MRLKSLCVVATGFLLAFVGCSNNKSNDPLVTGKNISPSAETVQNVGNFPGNLILTPDGRYLISTDMGYQQALWSIDTFTGKGTTRLSFPSISPKAATRSNGETADAVPGAGSSRAWGLYYGLAIDADGTLYAAQGAHDTIAVFDASRHFVRTIPTRMYDFPAGLALDDNHHLYVANNSSGGVDPFQMPGSMSIYDRASEREIGRYRFTDSHGGTSNFPLAIAVLHDGSKTYVASERDDCVYVLATGDPAHPALAATLPTGAHPVSLLFNTDQSRLYVANSLSDTVSVIDARADKVIDTIPLRPNVARDLPGVTPTAMALSKDAKTLYIALGDMNAVAVVDVAAAAVKGYIPAGWYPSAIVADPDGKHLFIANAKGSNVRNPNGGKDTSDSKRAHPYILRLLEGNVSRLAIPDADDLADATRQVIQNNHLDALAKPAQNPLASISLAAGRIKHVIYIIKENRTYDQVLGDDPRGNGDASLTLFGKAITPNQHALADRFVLLDNLYACGEVSGDGWCWSTQGMADAYVARNVPYNYSHRGRKFDFEGQNNGYPTGGFPERDEDGKALAKHPSFAHGAPAIPDVASTGNNIWDVAAKAGISFRNYGFFLYFADDAAGVVGGPDNYPASVGLLPPGHDLNGRSDIDFRRFDMDYPDSDAPINCYRGTSDPKCLYKIKSYGKYKMPSRYAEWNREFQQMLARDSTGSAVPALMMIRLPADHTIGAKPARHTPRSYVADNDYGLGEIVQAVSHSAIWRDTAIFIIEDDAQSGADHVDCHRTVGYVVSPWIKAGSVDHRFYNTDSMLKTMELILGLPPMTQYDAIADPIMDWDGSPSNDAPYNAIAPPKEWVSEINPTLDELRAGDPRRDMAVQSAKMDFTHADAAPADVLNEIIWKTVKGPQSMLPAARPVLMKTQGDD